jgi:hypothetical protein
MNDPEKKCNTSDQKSDHTEHKLVVQLCRIVYKSINIVFVLSLRYNSVCWVRVPALRL